MQINDKSLIIKRVILYLNFYIRELKRKKHIPNLAPIAARCCFIVGHARSGTTILNSVLNHSKEIYITHEADYFIKNNVPNFRELFNNNQLNFRQQVSKGSRIPNFVNHKKDYWFHTILELSKYYKIIGDKIAFTPSHFAYKRENFIDFYAHYFYPAKYIFIFRTPLQCIISSAKLLKKDDSQAMFYLGSWLKVVKLWCDMLRLFPNILTIFHDELNIDTCKQLSNFLRIDLTETEIYFDKSYQNQHTPNIDFKNDVLTEAQNIFENIKLFVKTIETQPLQQRGIFYWPIDDSKPLNSYSTTCNLSSIYNKADMCINHLNNNY